MNFPTAWLDRLTARGWAAGLFVFAVLQRLVLMLIYQPVVYNDTPSYRRLATAVQNGFNRYDGIRTPGYPLFLAFFQSDKAAWLAQMATGLVITMLFFYLGWQLSQRAWFGILAGLAHTLNPGQIFFEPNILSETVTTFWVVISLSGTVYWLAHAKHRSVGLACGIGLAASLAWLTRPLFIYLPFWILVFIALKWNKAPPFLKLHPSPVNIRLLVYLIPVLFILVLWANFIHSRFHQWGLTTMTGYHMIQHTGEFFEYVPDEYAALRDTYLKYREAHIAQYGTQANTIWEAIPELQKVTGKSFYDLSRLLASISGRLILEHPLLYLRNVIQGWVYFWLAPVYWSPEALRWEWLKPVMNGIILVERLVVFGINLVFIPVSLIALLLPKARHYLEVAPAWWCLLGSIWIASVLQTLVDHGDNPRFLIPLQSMVVLWVMWAVLQTVKKRKGVNVLVERPEKYAEQKMEGDRLDSL